MEGGFVGENERLSVWGGSFWDFANACIVMLEPGLELVKFFLRGLWLTLSQPGFLVLQKTKGAHCAPPPRKTLLPFSKSIQVKFFWKVVQKWVSWNNFGSYFILHTSYFIYFNRIAEKQINTYRACVPDSSWCVHAFSRCECVSVCVCVCSFK